VDIREIDVMNDALMKRFYAITRAAMLHERPGMPMWSEREATVMVRHQEESETWTCFGAFEGDAAEGDTAGQDAARMVGAGFMMLPQLDNVRFAWVSVNVEPERRNQGIGTAMAEHLIAAARAEGRTRLMGELNLAFADRESHPYRQFAEKRGFSLANTEVRRALALPVSDEQIQTWIDESAPHHTAYRIESFIGSAPDDLVPSLVDTHNQLALDAPTGELEFEAEQMTVEGYRERMVKLEAMGRKLYETVAVSPEGDVVAQSGLGVSTEDEENVFQWGTLVRREHRGHRLGMAVKAANLRALQRDFPDHKRIITTNAETNAPMVAINEAMGFEPIELLAEFQLIVDED
jgi:GNAT superfamily N-acetyltransferase